MTSTKDDRTDWARLRAKPEDEIERLAAADEDNPATVSDDEWARATNAEKLAYLRRAWQDGLDSGTYGEVDFETLRTEGRERLKTGKKAAGRAD